MSARDRAAGLGWQILDGRSAHGTVIRCRGRLVGYATSSGRLITDEAEANDAYEAEHGHPYEKRETR